MLKILSAPPRMTHIFPIPALRNAPVKKALAKMGYSKGQGRLDVNGPPFCRDRDKPGPNYASLNWKREAHVHMCVLRETVVCPLDVGKTKEIGFVSVVIARFMVRKAQTGVKCRH